DDVIALLEMRQAKRHDRRHAAGRGDAILGAFQRGEAFLGHGDGRVGGAGIALALLLTGKPPGSLSGAFENEAGSQVEGFGMLAELTALLPGTNGQGFQTIVGRCLVELVHQSWASDASCKTS